MSEQMIINLQTMLQQGKDNVLLRFSLGNAYLNTQQYPQAIEHLEHALQQDPHYSAAWKLYGKALHHNGDNDKASNAYRQGIEVAEKKGDIQAAKEMRVFLKRLL